MNNFTVKGWALALILLGLLITAYKVYELGLPLTPKQSTDVWTVQAQVAFEGTGGPAKLSLYVPDNTPGFMLLDEDFISSRFGLTIAKTQENRRADWAIRRARGDQTLYYRIAVARSNLSHDWDSIPDYPEAPVYPDSGSKLSHLSPLCTCNRGRRCRLFAESLISSPQMRRAGMRTPLRMLMISRVHWSTLVALSLINSMFSSGVLALSCFSSSWVYDMTSADSSRTSSMMA